MLRDQSSAGSYEKRNGVLRMGQIERGGNLPIYAQVKRLIIDWIERGELSPHDRLPGERELAAQLTVSRMTVRRALTELIHEQRISTQPGVGTFVAEPRMTRRMMSARGLSEDLAKAGHRLTSHVLELGLRHPAADIAAILKVPQGASVVVLERLRVLDDEPFALQRAYLPTALFPDLHTLDFRERSLYATIRGKYGLSIDRGDLTLEATEPSAAERDLLKLLEGEPVLVMVRISYTADEVPIEFIRSAYRGDKYKFSITLKD